MRLAGSWISFVRLSAGLALAAALITPACRPRPQTPPADVASRAEPMRERSAPSMRATPAPAMRARPVASMRVTPARPLALPLTLTLTAAPRSLEMAQRAKFMVRFKAVNRGTATFDPQLYKVQLLVNGNISMAWGLAIGNGPRDRRWRALPPGQAVEMGWALGKALFPKPGRYTLELRQGALRSAAVTVMVKP